MYHPSREEGNTTTTTTTTEEEEEEEKENNKELFQKSSPLPSLRTPLNTIPDPSQNPKQTHHSSSFKIQARGSHKTRNATPPGSFRAETQIPHFELVQDPSFWTHHNVQVLIRIRPISSTERALHANLRCINQDNAQTLSSLAHPHTRFTFDHVASETISQEELFRVAGLPMVENCMSGYNSCMFAYGQTGSGKTYTMMGDIYGMGGNMNKDCGMTPRIFEYLFTRISHEEERHCDENLRYSCKCSFLEIYNEQITDLLEPSSTNLQLREDMGKGVYVENLTEYQVTTVNDVVKLLLKGAANRKIAATNMNAESSRSHSVFTCVIESRRDIDSVTHLRFGRLNLVDLAGSERQKSSGAEGERLKESANINKSLSTLGLVIMTLVDVTHGKHRHVPYRDSRLTFLLQDSLGGNSKTTIIANISPSVCSASETLSTLKFAQRAKLIQNNAKVNEDVSGDVMALQRQIQQLKEQLNCLHTHQNSSKSLPNCWPNIEQPQSGDVDATCSSSLEGRISDHHKNRSFSKWKMGCINATLVGALRREKMAEASVRRLEAEIEHMNHLVHQLEEDAQRTKMILKFREEKIIKLELMSDGVISSGEYLTEENKALSEEIQLLQARTDRNPKLTRFALENIRLIEQLRMFQEFYEQDERETLLAEISEMRAQLMETVQENCVHLQYPKGTANQEQEKDLTFELENCRRNREACLTTNAKLTMKVDQLQRKLNTYTDCSRADLTADSGSTDSGPIQHSESHSSVEIISFRNVSKGKMTYCSNKDRIFQIRDEQNMDNVLDEQCKDPPKELMDANSLIETMEHEQLQLIGELEILEKMNTQDAGLLETKDSEHSKFLFKLENNINLLQITISPGSGDEGIWMEGSDDTRRFTFIIKLEGLNRDIGEARILNKIYLDNLASQIFHKNVRQQVEVETSKTILNLREELSKLQEEFQQKMISMTEENSRLKSTIEARENKLNMLSEEWEIALLELTSFLIDGSRSLKEASEQIGSIASSFPEKKAWISEQVGRAAGNFLKKESTIVKLQKSLETAQKLGLEMKSKLSSLQGAILAITEVQQLEQNEYSREVIQLRTLLTEKVVKIEDLEEKLNVDQIIEADKHANDSQTRCLETHNHLGVCNQEAFGQVCVQAASPQLQHLERSSKEAEAGCTNTVEVLHFKLDDVGEEKITMPSSFFIKFEEAQATVKEADDMLNEMVKANENAKHVSDRWKQAGAELMIERESLIEEVQQLKFSIGLKEAQYEALQSEMCSSLQEVALSVSSLEESFLQMQRDVECNLKVVYSDIFSLGQDLCSFTCRSRSSLEDIWAAIMENGLAFFVLYQCYVGNLLNNISSLKLDPVYHRHKQRNCYSVIDNVGEGRTRATGGSPSSKDTDKVEGYEIENLKHKLCSPRHTPELKPSFDLDYINIIAANLALQRELDRKDALLKGLLFDISLLQESTFSSNDMKDKTEQMFAALTMVRHELGMKTTQLDEILLQHRKLETQVVDCEAALCISNSKLKQADETIDVLSKNNSELMVMLNNLDVEKTAVKENLEEQKESVKGLEKEILRLASSVEKISLFSVEDNIDELINVVAERDRLREEVLSLNNRLEIVTALADENEAIAVEARQESKVSKVYAEQKEEEANILEHSVEELECTINALEKKVDDMAAEVERYYTMRDDEEVELQALRMRMLCFENSTEHMDSKCPDFGLKEYQTARVLIERTLDLEELKKQMRVLEREREDQAIEIKKCREHISELVLHGEAQASQYQHKYKTLEAMVREVITDTQASNPLTSTLDKAEKSTTRTRGSSSPFRCIASLVQQMKVEKDQEMEAALLKMEELEALASSRQKEVCMLNARLAAAENMTHDVIRDLLGVKLDMTNYATLIDKHQVHKSLEEAQQHIDESIAKEQEILKLSKKINDLTDERQSCIEEINQREADNLAAQVALEQLKQRDQMLTAQNEMLKMDKINLKKKMEKMEEMLKKHFGPHNMQQEILQPKVLKENNFLRSSSEKLRERLTNSDKFISRVNDELAWHPKFDNRDPHDKQ